MRGARSRRERAQRGRAQRGGTQGDGTQDGGARRTVREFHGTELASSAQLADALRFTARTHWRPVWRLHAALVTISVVGAGAQGLLPLAVSRVVASLVRHLPPWGPLALLVACMAVPPVLQVLQTPLDARRQRWADHQGQRELINLGRGMPDLGILGHGENNEVLHRVMRAVLAPGYLWSGVNGVVSQLVSLTVVVLGVTRLGWYIPVLFVLASVPHTIAARRTQYALFRNQMRREQDGRRAAYAFTTAAVPMLAREVRVFGLADFWQRRHERLTRDIARSLDRSRNRQFGVTVGFGFAYVSLVALVLLLSVHGGHRSASDLTLLVQSVLQLATLIGGAAYSWAVSLDLLNQSAEYLRLREQMVPHIEITPDGVRAEHRWHTGLVLRDVSYTYHLSASDPGARPSPDPGAGSDANVPEGSPVMVLDHLNLTVPAGKVVALVGENGEGKSTLVRLLTRMDDPTSGTIELDGRPLADYDLTSYRDGVAAVFQDHAHLALSMLDSVALGDPRHADPSASDQVRADVERAVDAGGARIVLEGVPDGIDRLLGAGHGKELSGGGWQRVATARAFYPDAAFVIFDEATSALDVDAERRLFDNFAELVRGRTALVISHRFSTVRTADLIAVLQKGRVSEYGTHEQLMALGGRYAELFNLQADRYR